MNGGLSPIPPQGIDTLRIRAMRALRLPLGGPDPGAPPCMRQRFLPRTAGERQAPPERILAPHRGLARIASVRLT